MKSESTPTRRRRSFSDLLLPIVGLALAAVTGGLLLQNQQLRASIAQPPAEGAERLEVGDSLPHVELKRDADGHHVLRLDEAGAGTALLVFSTECGACRTTLPLWNELAAELSYSSVRVLGIRVDDAEWDDADAEFPVLQANPETAEWLRNIPYVPATILLDDAGVVTATWYGALNDEHRNEIGTQVQELDSRISQNQRVDPAPNKEES